MRHGARIRYRLRLDGPVPFGALEQAVAVDPSVAVEELRATMREIGACDRRFGLEGRVLCTSSGPWEV